MTENTTASGAADDLHPVFSRVLPEAAPVAPAPQPAAPEGYVLVPVEPTPAMGKAAADAWLDCGSRLVLNKAAAAVAAGIAAAPKAASLQPDWCELRRLHALAVADADRILAEWRAYKPAPLQQGEYLPLAVASAPERIWLDLGFDPKETDADFSDLNTPTWSADNASGHGIEYVRADRAARGAAQAAPAMDAKQLGDAVVKWLGCETTKPRGDTGEPDRRIDVSVERLGFAVAAVLKTVTAPAPVAEDAAYTELHGQINYIAAYSVDALDALDRDRLLGFARSLVWRAQTSLEIANLARAQAAQPEGGAK